ncbi:MAG: DUF3606 domain-containing protein [Symplocastrum torsivum CPER-KK1]|jgi:hypothetical protein|uniref:DUF3606 domain-containing protein n=1 Tax=Symplocastrum torsivum CPER-KK1 TaxID=450513 RepID=A0A951PTP5_9CYAN|nr:DUF3606 domain-containing protein [Symplocastrum torsivum CPER-KK1]
MPDNQKIRRPLDFKRININQPYEVEYWSVRLGGVSRLKLELAVKNEGCRVPDVRKCLKSHPD